MTGQEAAALGAAALAQVKPDTVVGLGTGQAATAFIHALGKAVKEGLRVTGVPTSDASADLARKLGIPLIDEPVTLDVAVDGADEVDPLLDLVKGFGGALVREKLVAAASKRFVVVVDESKLVKQLGVGVLPVEVLAFLWRSTAERLAALGVSLVVRGGEETPFVTDNGNLILDLTVEGGIKDPAGFGVELKKVTGVVEHGLFVGMTDTVIVAGPEGPKAIGRPPGAGP